MVKKFFSPPVFNTEEQNFRAKFINGFSWAVIAALSLVVIIYSILPVAANTISTIVVLSALILVMLLALYILHKGNLRLSGTVIVVFGWFGVGIQAYTSGGIRDVIIVAYVAVSLLASIIVNWRVGSIVMILSIISIWTLAILETNGVFTPNLQQPLGVARDLTFVFIVIAILIYFSTTSLREAILRANKSEEKLRASNEDLKTINKTLEERVSLRTEELEKSNQQQERRVRQFEAVSQITRVIATIQDLDTLLPYLTQVISEQFNIYHAGIFLIDEEREFAILRAASSEGGKRMLERGHKLRIGQAGIVGFVTATGQSRIALDVGADAAYFDNPDLPETHSEMALPLRYAGQIIGALDIQSVKSNAFTQSDIEVLITLADQVSATIKSTLTIEEMRGQVSEYQKSIGESSGEAWKVMRPRSLGLGFQFIDSKMQPLEKPLEGLQVQDAVAQNKTVLLNSENEGSNLAIPIRLRGKVVGVINLHANNNYRMTNDDVEIIEAVTERLSLAMETASLLQSTRHRADIERVTTDISSKISSSSRFETILQTAAQELSRALSGSDVIVQIDPVSLELGMTG